MPRSAETCFAAAMGGSVAKLQYLVEAEGCPLPADISKTAVLLGSKSMLAFLKQQGLHSLPTQHAALRTSGWGPSSSSTQKAVHSTSLCAALHSRSGAHRPAQTPSRARLPLGQRRHSALRSALWRCAAAAVGSSTAGRGSGGQDHDHCCSRRPNYSM